MIEIDAIFSAEMLLSALVIAGVMQVAKIALRSASQRLREHPAVKVVLAALPMAIGALVGWLMMDPAGVHPVALGMVSGLFSSLVYSLVKSALGAERIEPRSGR